MRVVVNAGQAFVGLLQLAADGRVADGDFGDLAAAHQPLELAVGDLSAGGREEIRLAERQHRQRAEDPPDGGGPGRRRAAFLSARGQLRVRQ